MVRNTRLEYESATIRDDGEVLVLPKGWSTRASKTHGGKEYYVSPYGHTQWIRPPLRTGIMYKWVHEIEVAFDYGRLGLNLKQITAEPGVPFTDLQVHITEVYKVRYMLVWFIPPSFARSCMRTSVVLTAGCVVEAAEWGAESSGDLQLGSQAGEVRVISAVVFGNAGRNRRYSHKCDYGGLPRSGDLWSGCG